MLTLLIHLGYLAYDHLAGEVYIPNREVAEVFRSATKGGKWKAVEQAIGQIKDNRYDGALRDYFGSLLLAGINYGKDVKGKKAKKHSCVIERL